MPIKEDGPGIAIVTGGAAGIGAGIARRLLDEGYRVVVADWNQEHLDRFGASSGDRRLSLQRIDVSQPDQVKACVEACCRQFGTPTVLVNNAGLTLDATGGILDLSVEQWRRILSVNLDGAFYFSREVVHLMVQEGIPGRIVNIGSVNSLAAEKRAAAYCAAKGGILMLTRSLAVDLAPCGILVNCIAPGSIETDSSRAYFAEEPIRTGIQRGIPLGRAGMPAEIGEVVAFLISRRNTFMTGACLIVDGGMTAYLRFD